MTNIFLYQSVIWSWNPLKKFTCTIINVLDHIREPEHVENAAISGEAIRTAWCFRNHRTRQVRVLQIKCNESVFWAKATLFHKKVFPTDQPLIRVKSAEEFDQTILKFAGNQIQPSQQQGNQNNQLRRVKTLEPPRTLISKKLTRTPSFPVYRPVRGGCQITAEAMTDLFKKCINTDLIKTNVKEFGALNKGILNEPIRTEELFNKRVDFLCRNCYEVYEDGKLMEFVIRFSVLYSQILLLWSLKDSLLCWKRVCKEYCIQLNDIYHSIKYVMTQPMIQHIDLVRSCGDDNETTEDVKKESERMLSDYKLFLWNEKVKSRWLLHSNKR
ncbi:hypothetical protein QTN25_004644 [Entamoeba marina]